MNVASAPTDEELEELLKRTFTSSFRNGYVTIDNFLLPERYHSVEKDIREFEVYDTDVWICGFPKTGTTWISEIAWLILNDLDYEGAKIPDYKRTRQLEFSMLFDPKSQEQFGGEEFEMDSIGHARSQKHPRTIKSHFPFPLLPNQIVKGSRSPKIIYTARNPMDTSVSGYHQCKNVEGFTGSLEEFCKLFLFGKINFGPYPSHVSSFWEQRRRPNILFVTFEEMKKDLPGVVERVATFLGKSISREDSRKLQEYVSFDSMKNNPAVNKRSVLDLIETTKGVKLTPFIREGKAGGYKNVMSPEMIAAFHYWMKKRFEGCELNLID